MAYTNICSLEKVKDLCEAGFLSATLQEHIQYTVTPQLMKGCVPGKASVNFDLISNSGWASNQFGLLCHGYCLLCYWHYIPSGK